MSVFFLLSLLTFNIYLQKWIEQENALVTPRIRLSPDGVLNIILLHAMLCGTHAAKQTVHLLYTQRELIADDIRLFFVKK